MKQQFSIGQILQVTTGCVGCTDDFGDVYRVLNFLTQDSLATHQIPRAHDEVLPYLHTQLPWTKTITIEDMRCGLTSIPDDDHLARKRQIQRNVAQYAARYGEFHTLYSIGADDHERLDPVEEAQRMGLEVIEVTLPVPIQVGDIVGLHYPAYLEWYARYIGGETFFKMDEQFQVERLRDDLADIRSLSTGLGSAAPLDVLYKT